MISRGVSCVYTRMHACRPVCKYASMYKSMKACMHECMYARMHICMYVRAYWYIILVISRCRGIGPPFSGIVLGTLFLVGCRSSSTSNSKVHRPVFWRNHAFPFFSQAMEMIPRGVSCVYACMHACMFACRYASLCVCIQVCMHVCMHTCMYVDTIAGCTYVRMHACMHARMHARTCAYT